ncbi:hypothetical protein NT6N_26560 [Oceaniferula spumae]|uniref:Soluble ligand binding domain-containing protein n=1 Tax=Oceaniferula spumae TaxID=2979115 RepID=A0AAT9FNL9_9BACT
MLLMTLVTNAAEYRLQQTDVIRMTIYQEDDMTTEALIGKSGSVSFPLIGPVEVKGLTVDEVAKTVKDLYEKDYFVDPMVSVVVVTYAKKWVSISGAVENPGNVAYPEEGALNLASAVAMAGGIAADGNSRSITVARKKGGVARYSLSESGKITLLPGDTVIVPRLPLPQAVVEKTATISGEVRNPGNIKLPKSGKVDILTAIAQAGGFSKIANQKECIVQRKTTSGHRAMTVNLKDVRNGRSTMVFVYEGDIVIIKESRF